MISIWGSPEPSWLKELAGLDGSKGSLSVRNRRMSWPALTKKQDALSPIAPLPQRCEGAHHNCFICPNLTF